MAAGPAPAAPGAGQDPLPRGEPSRPTSGQSAPSYSTPGQSAPGDGVPPASATARGEAGDPPVPCGEAGAWWEGEELVDEDDLEAAGWADPPGQPLDEQAVRAARAASISAEVLGTGFWRRVGTGPGARTIIPSRSGFGSGDDLDELEPGPALAGLTDTATRPGRIADLDDDELIGALRAWRRLESWTAAGTWRWPRSWPAAVPRTGPPPRSPGQFPDQPSEFLADEIAAALTLTGPAAMAGYLSGRRRRLRAYFKSY